MDFQSKESFLKSLFNDISRCKSLSDIEATKVNSQLSRVLGVAGLTSMGVGAVVGAGVFVITGQAAAIAAGPALALSFIVSAVSCFFSGICYAEMAAAIPISGSAYTFTYVAVGEFAAWMVAICLALEYAISTAAVSVGWSASVQSFLAEFGFTIPSVLSAAPLTVGLDGSVGLSGALINFPAVFINVVVTAVLCIGVRESARFNNIFVLVKLSVLFIFITYGVYFAFSNSDTFADNLTPFIPENTGKFGQFGISGIFRGAGMVYFSYVGFDSLCGMAQECPSRDLPRGLMLTLLVCTVLYVSVTIVLTGMAPYTELSVDDPVPFALRRVGAPSFLRYCVDVGGIAGLTSVCLVSQLCMPRLVCTLSSDGLLPAFLASVHPKYKTPFVATILCGILSGGMGGLLPLDVLGELVSAGTLMAFMFVCYSVISFRRRHPEYPRPFKVPLVPYFPALGIALCAVQITSLPPRTLIYYALLQLGLFGVYVVYGRRRSVAGEGQGTEGALPHCGEKSEGDKGGGSDILRGQGGAAHASVCTVDTRRVECHCGSFAIFPSVSQPPPPLHNSHVHDRHPHADGDAAISGGGKGVACAMGQSTHVCEPTPDAGGSIHVAGPHEPPSSAPTLHERHALEAPRSRSKRDGLSTLLHSPISPSALASVSSAAPLLSAGGGAAPTTANSNAGGLGTGAYPLHVVPEAQTVPPSAELSVHVHVCRDEQMNSLET